MSTIQRFFMVAVLAAATSPALAQIGVSVDIGQPGFYGRIELGDSPRPQLIYAEPVVIEQVRVVHEPVYLRVPPGHAKDWRKHCAKYDACGRPTYFVQDSWYQNVYAPQYRERHGRGNQGGNGRDHDQGHGKSKGKGGKGHKDH